MGYLTGPVNNLTDYQAEYNGTLLGPGTAFQFIDGVPDFLDMATIKTMDVKRIWSDGSFAGPDYADVVLPQFSLGVSGSPLSVFQAAIAQIDNLFTVQPVGLPFWWKPPGLPARGILARVNKRAMPVTTAWNSGLAEVRIQLRCPDPAWQSVSRGVALASTGSNVSGLMFPMFNIASGTYVVPGVADFGATGIASSSGTLSNAGNTNAWPVVTVPGPNSGFTIQVGGGYVTYTGTLGASDSLVVDYSTGLATLNGTADRTYLLTSRQFIPVPPGGSVSVFFTSASGTCTVQTADIWR